jgi:hypothetical protein
MFKDVLMNMWLENEVQKCVLCFRDHLDREGDMKKVLVLSVMTLVKACR